MDTAINQTPEALISSGALSSQRPLSLLQRESSSSLQSSDVPSPDLAPAVAILSHIPSQLADFFVIGEEPRVQYSDWDIQQISRHLEVSQCQRWSHTPRLYTILRTIGQLPALDTMLEQGYSDYWLPFDTKSVPMILGSSMRNKFLETQSLVLTKAVDLEKSNLKRHVHFVRNDLFPFEIREKLGKGGYGTVDKIFSSFSRREFARKRFLKTKGESKGEVQSFRNELQVLKRIQHHHCIELVFRTTFANYSKVHPS